MVLKKKSEVLTDTNTQEIELITKHNDVKTIKGPITVEETPSPTTSIPDTPIETIIQS